jgi:putative membrane protein
MDHVTRDRPARTRRLPPVLAALTLVALPLSYVGAADRLTWYLEALPVLVGLPAIAVLWRRFPLSGLLCALFFVHAMILLTGAHYTYAGVPLGDWAKAWFGWQRNNFDKIGHFAQGFVPAVLTREILVRWSPFRQAPRGLLLAILCVAGPLAFAALYEIFEWQASIWGGDGTDAFVGAQGDPWDAQSDMLFCLIGAMAAVILLPRRHDRSIAAAEGRA